VSPQNSRLKLDDIKQDRLARIHTLPDPLWGSYNFLCHR